MFPLTIARLDLAIRELQRTGSDAGGLIIAGGARNHAWHQ
jgi:hypothetical protein